MEQKRTLTRRARTPSGEGARHSRAALTARPGLFVGRHRELAELSRSFEESSGGRFTFVLVAGEAGIGKTRLMHEFARTVSARGVPVLVAYCGERHATPAYGPWNDLLARLPRNRRAPPGLRHRVAARRDAPGGGRRRGSESGRTERLERVSSHLAELASRNGLVACLDDLQWADRDSLRLLEHLAREHADARILVLATAREAELTMEHPLARALGELVKITTFRRIRLGGLARREMRRYVTGVAARGPKPATVERVLDACDGNALLMVELAREWRMLQADPGPFRVPLGIREIAARRLSSLSTRDREVLYAAAVLGLRFDTGLLARMGTFGSASTVAHALARARRSSLVETVDAGGWRFAHALFRDALLAGMSPSRRTALHLRAARILDRAAEGGRIDAWSDVLHHLAADPGLVTGTRARRERIARRTLQAARPALRHDAPGKALDLLERALALLDGRGGTVADTTALAALQRERGRALHECGRESRTAMSRAFELFARVGDARAAVDVALSPAHVHLHTPSLDVDVQVDAAVDLRREALGLVKEGSIAHAGLLSGTAERRELERALRIARQGRDHRIEARCLCRLGRGEAFRGGLAAGEALLRKAVAAALASRDTETRHDALYWLTYPLGAAGNLAEARHVAGEMLENARIAGSRRQRWESHYVCAAFDAMAGDWASCRAHSEELLSLVPRGSAAFSRTFCLVNLGLVEYETGGYREGERRFRDIAGGDRPATPSVFPPAAVRIARIVGRRDGLDDLAGVASGPASVKGAAPLDWWYCAQRVARAGAAVLQGDRHACAEEREYFDRWRGCILPLGMAARAYDAVAGALAAQCGELDAALEHLRRAVAFCRASGVHPELAWSCVDLAETLLRRGGRGDRLEAAAVIEQGRQTATRLGMRPVLAVLASLAAGLGQLPGWKAALTDREGDVLRLVSRGCTNQEIGERLFISERTVATHLRNIFEKLGTANRAEATAWAMSNLIDVH